MSVTTRVNAKANATGAATFTWPSPARRSNRTGTVVVPLATAAAAGRVLLTTRLYASSIGSGGVGPVPVNGGAILSLVMTGLVPTVTYTGIFTYIQRTTGTEATAVLTPTNPTTITQFTGTVTAKITGPVTAHITNASIPVTGTVDATVTGTVDANITNASINVGTIDSITETVNITGAAKVQNVADTILQTGNRFDVLVTGQTFISTANPAIVITGAGVPHTYGALMVIFELTTTVWVYAVTVGITNGSAPRKFCASAQVRPTGTTKKWQCIVPGAYDSGVLLALQAFFSGDSAGKVWVLGFTQNPGIPMRQDGRAYPLGVFAASAAANTQTNVTLVAAITDRRIFLKTLTISGYGATAEATPLSVEGTFAGTTTPLGSIYQTPTATSFAVPIPDSGLLLDTDTALTIVVSGAATKKAHITATYDIVV